MSIEASLQAIADALNRFTDAYVSVNARTETNESKPRKAAAPKTEPAAQTEPYNKAVALANFGAEVAAEVAKAVNAEQPKPAAVVPAATTVGETPAAQPEPAKPAATSFPAATREQFMRGFMDLYNAEGEGKGRPACVDVLKELGIPKATEVADADLPRAHALVQKRLTA